MKMDILRCKTPEMVRKEIWAHLLAYNLLRTVMAVAANENDVEPRRISFKGAKQALTAFAPKLEAARPDPSPDPSPGAAGGAAWEQVREAHAALRALAPRVSDPGLRDELMSVCWMLTGEGASSPVSLAPREVDVLACVAAGATNAVAAERLGVRVETVKGYLRSAMRKLGAHTRGEAVVAARRAGVLP